MDFFEYIAAGKAKAGSQKQLAEVIGVRETHMSAMAKGKMPIPDKALAKLAMLIDDGTTPGQIWEAQQAARAATEEERQLWLPFVKGARGMAHAASIFVALGAVLIGTSFVSSPTLQAAPVLNVSSGPVFII
jgi:DNA-binding transcriptional regulator YdaS (Cro superfamily)